MKKNLGVVQAVYPMPVLIVAAYDENGKVNAMNAAWGMICVGVSNIGYTSAPEKVKGRVEICEANTTRP